MKKKITIIACTGLCALSLTGCQKQENVPVETETVIGGEETINPITTYMSGEELYEASGIDLANNPEVLNVLEEHPTDAVIWQMISNNVAEIILEYQDGSSYDFRASKTLSGLQELGGYYGNFSSETVEEGVEIFELDEGSMAYVYTEDDINYVITVSGPRDENIQPRGTVEVRIDSHVMEVATEYAKEQGYIFSDGALEALWAYLGEYSEEGYSDDYIKDVVDMGIEKAVARVEADTEGTLQPDALIAEDFEVEMTLY